MCGDRQLSREPVVSCCRCMPNHAGNTNRFLLNQRTDRETKSLNDTWQISYDVSRLFQINHQQPPRLTAILDISRKASVKDPCDNVYGLLGLLPTALSSVIQPNYSLSQEQAYIEFATSLLQTFRTLDEISPWCSFDPDTKTQARTADRLKNLTSRIYAFARLRASLSAKPFGQSAAFMGAKLEQIVSPASHSLVETVLCLGRSETATPRGNDQPQAHLQRDLLILNPVYRFLSCTNFALQIGTFLKSCRSNTNPHILSLQLYENLGWCPVLHIAHGSPPCRERIQYS